MAPGLLSFYVVGPLTLQQYWTTYMGNSFTNTWKKLFIIEVNTIIVPDIPEVPGLTTSNTGFNVITTIL
jgi:hypothetical protein